ncbi:MAG: alpha,alpha-trehalase TreF [Arcicella sp.]|jgi:alpha,alpha-trehalase|nr:alpha,alpha-trehalase TreF [Arcicella sp.]
MSKSIAEKYPFASTELFKAVQMSHIFPDSKTFTDYIPKKGLDEIARDYIRQKQLPNFCLTNFLAESFHKNPFESIDYQSDTSISIKNHLENLWQILTREPTQATGSLIELPYPYVVPGGRFQEMYYWDSYFTILGLQVSRKIDLIENIIDNFAYLINQFGFIPNGNRTYFLSRSQPPFFSLMVEVLRQEKGDSVLEKYLPALEIEYQFWMQDKNTLAPENQAIRRVVLLGEKDVLNRYWDELDTPRPESYCEDVALAEELTEPVEGFYRHIRAGAESGWDFSSRWFKDGENMRTIHTTDIIPIDLNCLLLNLEKTLAKAYQSIHQENQANIYSDLANSRIKAMETYLYGNDKGFYFDYDFKERGQTQQYTLAGIFPLFFSISTPEQAQLIAEKLQTLFLKDGGLITTLKTTGQQWDAPNGWAPLQYMVYKGLMNYGFEKLANEVKNRWMQTNQNVYLRTGKMTEKYNVESPNIHAGGGEYPNQDGFGWTNGVYLKFLSE